MANATVGTVNALVGNGVLADPAGDTLDTGTAAVTVPYQVNGQSHDVFFRVKNTTANTATVTVNAGSTLSPAFRSGLGNFSATLAAGATGWFGPFESSRFIQTGANAGQLSVTFAPSGGATIAGTITCFQRPKV